jgi:hypothetical protein
VAAAPSDGVAPLASADWRDGSFGFSGDFFPNVPQPASAMHQVAKQT